MLLHFEVAEVRNVSLFLTNSVFRNLCDADFVFSYMDILESITFDWHKCKMCPFMVFGVYLSMKSKTYSDSGVVVVVL